MPTYEYACPACKAVYELRQSFSAETTHTCEECGKGVAKRVLHAPPVVFKGSGWYVTDSRSSKSAVTSSAGDDTGGDKPAETKPAEKAAESAPAAARPASTETSAAS